MAESFAELFEQTQIAAKMRPGTIVTGKVLDIGPDVVIVSAGFKSEAMIPKEQFQDDKGDLEVTIGDEVDVALDAVEDGFGATRLSREKAKRAKAWSELEEAHKEGATVTGVITDKVKGGFTVDVKTIRAFLPGSLVDVRPVRDTSYLQGKPLEFKVIKVDKKRNNAVVSRRAVVESENSADREALLEHLKEGAVLRGTVKNLTDYGAFIDLGGIDGLLHITDVAWKRVRHPSEVLTLGADIDVKVLKFDRERMRVSLGLKQLGDDPWGDLARRCPVGARVFGKVTNIADYGCFVEIEEGVEGLVHVSEMDWVNKNAHPGKLVHLGQEVEVMVLDIDEERRRVSLGMKQCRPNPWEAFAANHNKGDRVQATIKSITDFGIFIGLEGGIDGLVHLSDLSWSVSGEEAVRNYKKGEAIEAVVLSVDAERERIALGVKQLEEDPLSQYLGEHPKGSSVKGKVQKVDAKSVVVSLTDRVEGYIRVSELSRAPADDARKLVKIGDEVEAMLIGVDRKKRILTLSVKAKEAEDEEKAIKEYSADSEGAGGTKLGEILKHELNNQEG